MGAPIAEIVEGAVNGTGNIGLSAYQIYKNREDIRHAKRDINNWNTTANNLIDEANRNNLKLSGEGDLAAYQKLKQNFDPNQFVYDYDSDTSANKVTFDKNGYNVEDYLNPYMQNSLDAVKKTLFHQSAGSGLGRSSGAVAAAAGAVADKSAEFYDKANEQMRSDRSFDYGMYTDYINQQQNKLKAMQEGYKTQMDTYRNDLQFDQDQQDNYLNNKIALGNSMMQAKAALV